MTKKEIKQRAARFVKFVEWSDEDQLFIGRCPTLFMGGCHGKEEAKVYAELCQIVEEWIEILEKDGTPLPEHDSKKFSGKFVLRLEPAMHHRLALKALATGESLNSYCVKALAKA